jgi:small conductance mechanosensitive channel
MALALPDQLRTTFTGETVAITKAGNVIGDLAVNLVIAVAILLGTLWLSKWAGKLVQRGFHRFPRHHDDTLADFASSIVRYSIVIVGGVAILHRLGVETTSIITVLGAASLAVGLALQGALSNVAAGVMILIFRPFRVGDFVAMAGKQGTVKRLDLFNTELADVDGLKVFVPNGKGFGDVIVNYTDIPRRRMELVFGIGYDDDIGKACEVAMKTAAAHAKVLAEPAPWCRPTELAASTVNIALRCWAPVQGYWDTRYEVLQAVKEAFDREKVSLPFPTQVSLMPANEGGSAEGQVAPPLEYSKGGPGS